MYLLDQGGTRVAFTLATRWGSSADNRLNRTAAVSRRSAPRCGNAPGGATPHSTYDQLVGAHFDAGDLLDEPAVVAVRRVARSQAERVSDAWHELASADLNDRSPGGAAAEALHDFRVALRSLRSWLRAHQDALAVPRKVRRRLRRAARATNASRDAEVLAKLLAGLQELTRAGLASSRWWQERLGERARDPSVVRRARRDIERGLEALEHHLAVVRWEQSVDDAWDFAPLAAELATRLQTYRDALQDAFDSIHYTDREVTVHAARIAAKRVRYLLDPVKRGVAEAPRALKLLRSLQDDLGELHDLHIARDELDNGVIERAAHEASERSREILHAAGEGRSPRRFASKLGGFASVAAAVREEERARYKEIEERWLHDRARALFAAIDTAIDALARRGRTDAEIERKYLLRDEPLIPNEDVTDVVEIEQGYLPGERISERLRREHHADGNVRLVRTLKSGKGLVRREIEEPISSELFDALWPLTAARRIRKRRTKASVGTKTFEIDVFRDRPLVLAELELETVDEAVDLPPWILDVLVADVTDDTSYSNAKLAQPATSSLRRSHDKPTRSKRVSEIAERYRKVAAQFTDRATAVPAGAWDHSSPCEGWVARDIVRHMVEWMPGFLRAGAAVELPAGPSPDEDPVAAWCVMSDGIQRMLDAPDVAAREFVHERAGRHSLEEAVAIFLIGDVVIHTWDLARATGLDERLDRDEVQRMFSGMEPHDEMLRQSGQYGPRVEVPDDADEQTKLIAFMGRRP